MVRLSRADLKDYYDNAASNLGSSDMYLQGSQIVQLPPGGGGSIPPGGKPAPPSPNGRGGLNTLRAVGAALCSLYRASPGGFIDTYLDFSEFTNSRSVADGMLSTVCGAPPAQPPDIPAGGAPLGPSPNRTTGGQCDGRRYILTLTVSGSSAGTVVRALGSGFYGPIGNPGQPQLFGSSSFTYFSLFTGRQSPQGAITTFNTGNYAAPDEDSPPPTFRISAVPHDGGSDECGDPAGDIPTDPDTPIPPELPPFDFDPGDGGGPQTQAPEVRIVPGPDGPAIRVRYPDADYYIDPGGVVIENPTIPADCCPPNAPVAPPDSQQPSPEDPDPDPTPPEVPGDDPDTEEPETAMVAVVVTASSISTYATPIGSEDGGPIVYAPRLGSLQFKIEAGNGVSGWTTDIDVKNAQQYISVPAPQGAVDVRVFPYGATQFSIKRLYAPVNSPLGRQPS